MGDPESSQVLVTGGSGFIGRRVVRALLHRGDSVTVADQRPFPGAPRRLRAEHDLKSGLAMVWPEFAEAEE